MNTIKDYIEAVNRSLSLTEAKDAVCKHCGCHFEKPHKDCKCTHAADDPTDDCWVSPAEYKKMQKESVNESASMNVSMSGDNASEVAELMKLMQNAGMSDAGPVIKSLDKDGDMDHDMDDHGHDDHAHDCGCDGPCDCAEPEGPVMALPMPGKGPDMAKMRDLVASADTEKKPAEEDYENEPDEEYQNVDYMTKDLSGGLNKQKKMYAKAQDGDNAMAVEELEKLSSSLKQAYESFKSQYTENKKPDFLDVDKDGDKEEPMSKAAKDKKDADSEESKDEKGLSDKQKKLPAGLQKAIANKNK